MTEPNVMKQDELDSFLGDLEHELSVTPSPDFAARVRARVERETSRTWSPSRWFFGAFALASAAVVMIMFWNRPESTSVPPTGAAVASHQPAAPAPPTTSASAAAPTVTSSTPAVPRPVRRPARGPASLHATSQGPIAAELVNGDPMTVDPTIHTLEVIVPPDQEIAIRRMLIALRAGGSGAPPPGSSLPAGQPLPDVPLIVIAPIRIDALPGPVNGGGRR